jgi:hypothetical protein
MVRLHECIALSIVWASMLLYIHLLGTGFIQSSFDMEVALAIYIASSFVALSIVIVGDFKDIEGWDEQVFKRFVKIYIVLLTIVCIYLACNIAMLWLYLKGSI